MIIILMGVAGSGKTTIGRMLAAALQCGFLEGDEFHSAASVEKMKHGIPLTDEDREPWLRRIRVTLTRIERCQKTHVVACSALKQQYRDVLGAGDPLVKFVYLRGTFDVLAARLQERKGHFFDGGLLASQFDTLEEPQDAVSIDVASTPQEAVDHILGALGLSA
jgi:gluconokinase